MSKTSNTPNDSSSPNETPDAAQPPDSAATIDQSIIDKANKVGVKPREYGGPAGLEPTRYGDWESKGRCVDF